MLGSYGIEKYKNQHVLDNVFKIPELSTLNIWWDIVTSIRKENNKFQASNCLRNTSELQYFYTGYKDLLNQTTNNINKHLLTVCFISLK